MNPDDITARIQAALPDAEVTLEDLTGTEDHWKARIVSGAIRRQVARSSVTGWSWRRSPRS